MRHCQFLDLGGNITAIIVNGLQSGSMWTLVSRPNRSRRPAHLPVHADPLPSLPLEPLAQCVRRWRHGSSFALLDERRQDQGQRTAGQSVLAERGRKCGAHAVDRSQAQTFLEVIRARWGRVAHIVFTCYALITSLLVSSMLVTVCPTLPRRASQLFRPATAKFTLSGTGRSRGCDRSYRRQPIRDQYDHFAPGGGLHPRRGTP